jgi:hypothetical protein
MFSIFWTGEYATFTEWFCASLRILLQTVHRLSLRPIHASTAPAGGSPRAAATTTTSPPHPIWPERGGGRHRQHPRAAVGVLLPVPSLLRPALRTVHWHLQVGVKNGICLCLSNDCSIFIFVAKLVFSAIITCPLITSFRKCETSYPVTSWLPCPPLLNIPDCTSPGLSSSHGRLPLACYPGMNEWMADLNNCQSVKSQTHKLNLNNKIMNTKSLSKSH